MALNKNEALNMSVSRYVHKFKHYGTSMSLDTRIRCAIGSYNMGYDLLNSTLLDNLGCTDIEDGKNSYLSSGIKRIYKTNLSSRSYKLKLVTSV